MRLRKSNIKAVCGDVKDGITYGYFVIMKSGCAIHNKAYRNFNENGRSTTEYYDFNRLPRAVQRFLEEGSLAEVQCFRDGFIQFTVK